MVFRPVPQNISFPSLERQIDAFWKSERIFEKSLEASEGKPVFMFYEGPPTANGMPHPGHVLTRIMKDVFPRYKNMRGFHAPRRGGWDTHGLPVEVEVEKSLGIHGRKDIEQYGIEAFTRKCIDSVFVYIDEWKKMSDRIGFWVDLDRAYVTFHENYIESVWWALSELHKQGLLYQDYKVVWWWPQGGTALSAGEVGQGYKTVDDPSVVVRFKAVDLSKLGENVDCSLLAWTTTPWTLPSNIALAVSAGETYALVNVEGERVMVAKALVEKLFRKGHFAIEREYKGSDLAGIKYEPIFRYAEPEGLEEGKRAFEVLCADFVTLDSGTGVVHMAPAFGEDDFRVTKQAGFAFLQLIAPDGTFKSEVSDFAGRFCKEADRDIIRWLKQHNVLFSESTYRHDYPYCWRADNDPLIQYARKSWFIRTTQFKEAMLQNNDSIHWEPEHIKEGRFGDFLRSNVDWALSRERYWGTPLPIWVNDVTGKLDVISSVADILERNPNAFDAFNAAKAQDPSLSDHLRVHKPWVDNITWTKKEEPGVYRRVPEVIDCWFDSGCMPFAQLGYPHKNRDRFSSDFPADFITEAVDQTRGWFYTLLAISTMLFKDQPKPHPFKNCVVLGLISDEKGQKLSKSKKNYQDPMLIMDEHGADAMRWSLYASCVPGQTTKFFAGASQEAVREFLLKIWNVYSFFVTYANIDRWDPARTETRPELGERSDLDRWILAELDATLYKVCSSLDGYQTHPSAQAIQSFVDALSNWYVRRSRGRFWSDTDTPDKRSAFWTLYEVLVNFTKMVAPFTPFLAEELYQNLVRSADANSPISVHLTAFPVVKPLSADQERLIEDMDRVRTVVRLGQHIRAKEKIGVRQPLNEMRITITSKDALKSLAMYEELIKEELNVHRIVLSEDATDYVNIKLLPNYPVLGKTDKAPKLPALRKAMESLSDSDRSKLYQQLNQSKAIAISGLSLNPDEVEVRLEAKTGFAAASEYGTLVILSTDITPELKLEGVAREIINRVQKTRKDLNLAYEQRIRLYWQSTGLVAEAFKQHAAAIAKEVLATDLQNTEPAKLQAFEHTVESQSMVVWLETV